MKIKSFFKSFISGLFCKEEEYSTTETANQEAALNLGEMDLDEGSTIDASDAKDNKPETPESEHANTKDNVEDVKNKESETKQSAETAKTYNLIILDESGSMNVVRSQTISGCNETLNSIRNIAKEHESIKQLVSIFCFDTSKSRYLMKNVPIEEARDLTPDDYRPNACTPLYDAIGYTVTQLRELTVNSDTVAVVTIITDGYENASKRWNHNAVLELINSLKKQGWTFTFIGANIDVEKTARGLGINSYMQFDQTDEGMSAMFEQERRSRRAYYEKQRFIREQEFFTRMQSDEEKKELLGAMNDNYFVEKQRVAPNHITQLHPNEVFVFGSNIQGLHNGGAALFALQHFGAINGQAEGIQGNSYAIPTDGNTFYELQMAVRRFTEYAVQHPKLKFMLCEIGCGAAGYRIGEIAPLFIQAYSFGNVYLPASFLRYMPKDEN